MRYTLVTFLFLNLLHAAIISKNLQTELNSNKPYIKAMVIMKERANIAKIGKGAYKEKAMLLREVSRQSQKEIIQFLTSHKNEVLSYRSYWISNALYVNASPTIIRKIAEFPGVYMVKEVSTWHILKTTPSLSLKTSVSDKTVEWNIDKIKADSVWTYYGYSGNGVNVGILDTGIDPSHPALSGNFSGHFHDAVNGNTSPYDDHGHGTHVAGTIAGGDGPGPFQDDIGIAYNALLSSCKAFDDQGQGSDTSILDCSQWFVSLKADSGVDIRIISNSWGGEHGNPWMWSDVWNNWRGMDIIPVFAAGNSGPGAETVSSPGDYPFVIGVGATDINDSIADFSSRGPAPDTGLYADTTYWSRPDWNFIKPDICAPGVGIRSSLPNGQYDSWDGTSMATPHVTGVIALMLEKNPSLDYETVYDILTNHAVDTLSGITYPNNDYGWGRINALLAIENTPSLTEPFIVRQNVYVVDTSGNNNGLPDPGETVNLYVALKNLGTDLSNVSATLNVLPQYASKITILDNTSYYGIMPKDSIKNGDGFVFTVDTTWRSGLKAQFELIITGDSGYTKYDTFQLQIGIPKYYTWFYFDYSDMEGWTTNGTWDKTTTTYHSSPSSATDSPQGEYANDTHNYMLLEHPFDLSDAYFARITLWHKYNFENNYDFGYIQVSSDSSDNAQWTTIASYTDSILNWVADTINIPSQFMGQSIFIRFLVESDGSATRDGWYVDDVKLEKDVPLQGVHLQSMGIEVIDSTGNYDHTLDPGETGTLLWHIKNIGQEAASNIHATIFCSFQGITLLDDTSFIDTIEPDSTIYFTFKINASSNIPHGSNVPLILILQGDNVDDTLNTTLQVGKVFFTEGDSLYIALDDADTLYTPLAPHYEQIDLQGNAGSISLRDDDRQEVSLPFTFKFYGIEYTSLWVCSNGWISFGNDPGTNAYQNAPLPSPDTPNTLIAPLWADLDPSSGGNIYYLGDTTNHRFLLQFKNVPFYGSTTSIASFTVILYDPAFYPTPTGDGDILVLYDTTPNRSNFSVGIEDSSGNIGLEYYYNGNLNQGAEQIVEKRAVLFTTKSLSKVKEQQQHKTLFSARVVYLSDFSPVLKLNLPKDGKVKISLYDVSGRRRGNQVVYKLSQGSHTISLGAMHLRKGVYFAHITSHNNSVIKKFLILK